MKLENVDFIEIKKEYKRILQTTICQKSGKIDKINTFLETQNYQN